MTSNEQLDSKKDKKYQNLYKIVHYLHGKNFLIDSLLITIITIVFLFIFCFYLGILINTVIRHSFGNKNIQYQILKSIIFLFLLLVSYYSQSKVKSNLNTKLTTELQNSLYNNKSIFNEKSINIKNIASNFINNFLTSIQNLTFLICVFILACLLTLKVTIIITIILSVLLFVSQIGNEFVDQIDKETKTIENHPKTDEEKFLSSLTSVESLNKDLFECDRYCQICVLYDKVTSKYPIIKNIVIECSSMLLSAFFVFYSSYLKFEKCKFSYKEDDIGNTFVFVVALILNEIILCLKLLDSFQKLSESSNEMILILDKSSHDDQEKQEKSKMKKNQ